MTLNEIIETASEKPLDQEAIGLFCQHAAIELPAFCDQFAHTVAHRYARGEWDFGFCDGAINNLYGFMMVHCTERLPDYAFEVFLAFDDGEYHHAHDPRDADPEKLYTQPQIVKIIAAEQNA